MTEILVSLHSLLNNANVTDWRTESAILHQNRVRVQTSRASAAIIFRGAESSYGRHQIFSQLAIADPYFFKMGIQSRRFCMQRRQLETVHTIMNK